MSDMEEQARRLARDDPGDYIRLFGDRPGFLDREARIEGDRRVEAEIEGHEENDRRDREENDHG